MNPTTSPDISNQDLNPRLWRLRSAARTVLADRRILWAIVAIVAAGRAFGEIPLLMPVGADASQFLEGGRQALADPAGVYPGVAGLIARGFTWTVTWPPPQILISILYSLLPEQIGIWAWTLTNGLLVLVGLALLFRALGSAEVWALPAFVLVCLLFTPIFEEVRLGQRSGLLLLTTAAAMLTVEARPRLAGALAGLGTAWKFFPAVLALSVNPRQWLRFTGTLIAVAGLVLLVTFVPFGSPLQYVTGVLLPVATGNPVATHDCFQNSVPLLFSRLVGGQSFSVIDTHGTWRDVTISALQLPWLAALLAFVTRALLVVGTLWAGRRSGWSQPYSLAMAFSLGALIPGDVYTYQFLCVLPLATVLVVRGIEHRQWLLLAVVGVCLWLFISSPCALIFPGLWTVAALGIFGAGLASARTTTNAAGSRTDPRGERNRTGSPDPD